MKTSNKGQKFDGGKPDLSIIPYEAMEGVSAALMYGEKKYGRFNYKNGIEYTRLISAALRHLYKFLQGVDIDDESGLNHIDHALANLAMLKFMMINKKEMDNRQ